jgi:hypothetical protein
MQKCNVGTPRPLVGKKEKILEMKTESRADTEWMKNVSHSNFLNFSKEKQWTYLLSNDVQLLPLSVITKIKVARFDIFSHNGVPDIEFIIELHVFYCTFLFISCYCDAFCGPWWQD